YTTLFRSQIGFSFARDRQRGIKRHTDRFHIFIDTWTASRKVNEDAPHNLRGHAEEVRAVLPAHCFPVDQADVSFVDERGGLQEMVRALAAHVALGEPVELSMNERREFFEGFLLAVAPRCQKLSKLVSPRPLHGPRNLSHFLCATSVFSVSLWFAIS